MDLQQMKYPIGKWVRPTGACSSKDIEQYVQAIEDFPELLRARVDAMEDSELMQPYRPEGWTKAQVVNHLADSHLNAYIRVKHILTEDRPTLRTYEEQLWAELQDGGDLATMRYSISILTGVHTRLVVCLGSLAQEDWKREGYHPGLGSDISLLHLVSMYAWHGSHHLAHLAM